MLLFDSINYLKHGTTRQQQAYNTLKSHNIIEKLISYTPILAGTIPLNIDIAGSDLDILCYYNDLNNFIETLCKSFSDYKDFTVTQTLINNQETALANFWCDGFEVEVFGQNLPVKEQMGYLHMVTEYKILEHYGNDFRQQIIALKNAGYKTEPAFAKLLGLEGNPYMALLEYKF